MGRGLIGIKLHTPPDLAQPACNGAVTKEVWPCPPCNGVQVNTLLSPIAMRWSACQCFAQTGLPCDRVYASLCPPVQLCGSSYSTYSTWPSPPCNGVYANPLSGPVYYATELMLRLAPSAIATVLLYIIPVLPLSVCSHTVIPAKRIYF
jgi:hypothetical protein